MAGPGMKLLPPDKFDGDTDFERFVKRMTAYVGCRDANYCQLLTTAERSTEEIDNDVLTALDQDLQREGRAAGLVETLNTRL